MLRTSTERTGEAEAAPIPLSPSLPRAAGRRQSLGFIMTHIRFTAAAMVLAVLALGLSSDAVAQPSVRPTIHHVTLNAGAGVLTITGEGFGGEPVVTVDGQAVAVLTGGSETRLDVLAPATLLVTPGSYRLTVLDPVRQIGDVFVVSSEAGTGNASVPANSTGEHAAPQRQHPAPRIPRPLAP